MNAFNQKKSFSEKSPFVASAATVLERYVSYSFTHLEIKMISICLFQNCIKLTRMLKRICTYKKFLKIKPDLVIELDWSILRH